MGEMHEKELEDDIQKAEKMAPDSRRMPRSVRFPSTGSTWMN